MIDKINKIKCPWCSEISTAEEWNNYTISQCKSREMRRAYTPIYKEKTFKRVANTFYKCPLCDNWSRGCQLSIVETTDKELLKLGGEALLKEELENVD